jgi:uncharacterized membrane protein YidH (DUF202 family)
MVEIREDFCGLCMVVPIALAGAGVAGLSAKEYKKRKWFMLSIGIIVVLVSLFLLWYYQDCESCKV